MLNKITRRGFFRRTGMATAGGLSLTGLLSAPLREESEPNWITKPEWLNLTKEPAIEPELPIIDPHHHLWDRNQLRDRYMLEELLEDTKDHNVRQTVFVECSAMYRADGPEEFKVVGETEFVQGVAAKSASGDYGETRVATGIVGSVDLRAGERVAAVLESQIAASRYPLLHLDHGLAR